MHNCGNHHGLHGQRARGCVCGRRICCSACMCSHSTRMQGIPTLVLTNATGQLLSSEQEEGRRFNEVWLHYPDNPGISTGKPGDARAAVTPALVQASLGSSFEWLIYADVSPVSTCSAARAFGLGSLRVATLCSMPQRRVDAPAAGSVSVQDDIVFFWPGLLRMLHGLDHRDAFFLTGAARRAHRMTSHVLLSHKTRTLSCFQFLAQIFGTETLNFAESALMSLDPFSLSTDNLELCWSAHGPSAWGFCRDAVAGASAAPGGCRVSMLYPSSNVPAPTPGRLLPACADNFYGVWPSGMPVERSLDQPRCVPCTLNTTGGRWLGLQLVLPGLLALGTGQHLMARLASLN